MRNLVVVLGDQQPQVRNLGHIGVRERDAIAARAAAVRRGGCARRQWAALVYETSSPAVRRHGIGALGELELASRPA